MAALCRHAVVPTTSRRTTLRSTRARCSASASSSSANCFSDLPGDEEEEKRLRNNSPALAVGYERALALWRLGSVHAAAEAFGASSHAVQRYRLCVLLMVLDCQKNASTRRIRNISWKV
jgi:hypothetical protein